MACVSQNASCNGLSVPSAFVPGRANFSGMDGTDDLFATFDYALEYPLVWRRARVPTLTVTTIHSETNATNRNYTHIHVDEETGFYYVSSVEPGQSGNHSVYRGSLSAAPGTAPVLFATVGNINEMTPRDMTLESAPTLTGTGLAPGVTRSLKSIAWYAHQPISATAWTRTRYIA